MEEDDCLLCARLSPAFIYALVLVVNSSHDRNSVHEAM